MNASLSILQSHIKEIIPGLQRKPEEGFTYPWVAAAYGLPYPGSDELGEVVFCHPG